MLSADTVLQGRYRIVRQLGQGGMGAVYEAVDERLDTVVALKETLFADEKLRKQFEREARLLARLHHPALPRVSDHFNEGDGQFLVMQYIQGEDLFEMQGRRQTPFPPEDVLLWGDQLCDALDYLHTQDPQIIHRDIKPQNLKFTDRGQIVLLDFGLAKGSAGTMSVVTTSASIFGYTPNYAPLEQVQGLGTDPRSDIYSLAATLYHLATNVKPPDALSRASAIVNGLPDPLVPANAVAAGVSNAMALVLNKGMSQKRDERFISALAMRDALRAAATHSTGEAATVLIAGGGASGGQDTIVPEAQTRLTANQTHAFGNEARTLLATDAAGVRGRNTATGETVTVVRPAGAANRSRMWLGAGLLLLLIAVGAGGFYIYKVRQAAAAQSATAAPQTPAQPAESPTPNSPAVNTVTDAARNTEAKSQKPALETSTPRAASRAAAKTVETSKPVETRPLDPTPSHNPERNPDRGRDPRVAPPPDPPNFDPFRPRQPGHPPGTGQTPGVRKLPNGTSIVTHGDGTRVFTFPDGTVRVVPPANRRNLRRNRP